jgi:phosphatidate cytidylyltransferase
LALRDLDGGGSLGRDWLLFAVLVTFATDSGAYFTGRLLGRRPLAPNVSPGKTWEGSAGGFVFAVAAALVLGAIFDLRIALWQVGVVGATVGVASQWGDLLESKLKRIAGVKDAGNLFPGHGGILDRLDSIVISVPAVYYLVATVFTP